MFINKVKGLHMETNVDTADFVSWTSDVSGYLKFSAQSMADSFYSY